MKHKWIIVGQAIFLIIVIAIIYILYPKTSTQLNGNIVKFDSVNAKVIIISNNPDFSNPRYIDLSERNNITFDLEPGTYYWKSDNGLIEGISHKFTIDSEVGMNLNDSLNESDLVNIGNVKINVTRNSNGVMVGHIILDPDQSEKVDDSGDYIGRQS